MEFLHPAILWGLLALIVPILIHLFYFRRFKKIYFSNVKFLKEIKEETSSRNKLKNFLILLSRLLAIAALVFAFAQPFLPQGKEVNEGTQAVSIFLDNSFSMKALSSDIPLFDKAKQKAKEIIEAYSNEDQFQILSHDLKVKEQRLLTKEDALLSIENLTISPSVKTLDRIYDRQLQALENAADNNSLYILSDFQKSICEFRSTLDTAYDISFVPFQSVQESNVAIDSVWLSSPVLIPNQNNKLLVKTVNHSDQAVENVRLTIAHNGKSKPLGQLNIPARSARVDTANVNILKTGWQDFKVNISDYPIQFDDEYLVSYSVPDEIKVLSLNSDGTNKYLASVFGGISYFNLKNERVSKMQYADLKNYNLVILNELNTFSSGLIAELSTYVINGGNLLLFPSKSANKESYNSLLNSLAVDNIKSLVQTKKEVSKINTNDFIFSEVYIRKNKNLKLPVTQSNYEFTNYSNRGRQDLLNYRDGSMFLGKYQKDLGYFYICSAPLDKKENDLTLNAEVFVPMLYKMALNTATSVSGSYTIGKNRLISTQKIVNSGESTFNITGPKEFIPKQTVLSDRVIIDVDDQIEEKGVYSLSLKDEALQNLAFNYDRVESDLSYYGTTELKTMFGDRGISIIENAQNTNFTEVIGDKERGVVLWKWCLIFTLIFLAIETLLIRLWK